MCVCMCVYACACMPVCVTELGAQGIQVPISCGSSAGGGAVCLLLRAGHRWHAGAGWHTLVQVGVGWHSHSHVGTRQAQGYFHTKHRDTDTRANPPQEPYSHASS